MHDVLANKGAGNTVDGRTDEPLTSEESYEVQRQTEAYLSGELEDIEQLSSMRQVGAYLTAFRNSFLKADQEARTLMASHESISSDKVGTAEEGFRRKQTQMDLGVGEVEERGEFGLGLAPGESKPVTKIEISREREEEIARMEQFSEYSERAYEVEHEA